MASVRTCEKLMTTVTYVYAVSGLQLPSLYRSKYSVTSVTTVHASRRKTYLCGGRGRPQGD